MLCFYPTTTIAIDDEQIFLDALSQCINLSDFTTYSSINTALSRLNQLSTIDRIKNRILKTHLPSEDYNSLPIQIDIHKLHEEIYNQSRFNDISVIIIDYHMGDVHGVEICEQLINHPAKKILLTGAVDKENIAIDAFNRGIIHQFISKTNPDLLNILKNSIAMLKEDYFRSVLRDFISNIPTKTSLLHSQFYYDFIKNIRSQLNAVEHYIIDATGSTLFLDADANPAWLVIKSEYELSEYVVMADDHEADSTILETLKHREKIPFFFHEEDYEHPPNEWEKFLHKAEPFPNAPGYYYTLITQTNRPNLNVINSYNQYIKNLYKC